GMDPLDMPYFDFKDDFGLEREAREAAELGFTGKAAIHPAQVPIINRVFVPSEDEVAEANALLAAASEAFARGQGAFVYKGSMVDAPHINRARKIVARAQAAQAAGWAVSRFSDGVGARAGRCVCEPGDSCRRRPLVVLGLRKGASSNVAAALAHAPTHPLRRRCSSARVRPRADASAESRRPADSPLRQQVRGGRRGSCARWPRRGAAAALRKPSSSTTTRAGSARRT